jgi:hypothetical protein
MPMSSGQRLFAGFSIVLFLGALAYDLALGSLGWHNTVLDGNAFRESQTALTAYHMVGHRYALAYETPVLGPPWSIPYEFPLYQGAVAALATVSGWPVDETGRLVARLFFLLTLLPCYVLLGRLGVSRPCRLVVLALLLASPFYIFWSRTFLIESTALFLAMCYLAFALAYLDNPRWAPGLAALSFGVLAGVVKITTCFVVSLLLVLAVVGVLRSFFAGRLTARALGGRLAALAILLAVPAGTALLWTRFADAQKEQNQFGRFLTSDGLTTWNFGTREQRLSTATWNEVLGRSPLAVPHPGHFAPGGGAIGVGVLALACLAAAGLARRRVLPVAACLLAYFVPPLVFTNLYWFHEYYPFANHIFLIGAVGLALTALYERGPLLKAVAAVAVLGSLALSPWVYADHYYPMQTTNVTHSLPACQAVRDLTAPDDVILVVGCDWCSEVPYYCRRRALMITSWWPDVRLELLPQYLEATRDYRLGALVVHSPDRYEDEFPLIRAALAERGLQPVRRYQDEEYDVYALTPLVGE